jgi:hypothetical protein
MEEDTDDGGVELAAAAAREPSVPGPPPTVQPNDSRTFHSTLGEMAASPQNGALTPSGAEAGRPWPFPSDASNNVRRWADENPQYPQERPPHMAPELPLDERMGVDFLLENNGQRRYVDPNSRSPPRGQATITTNGVGQYVYSGYTEPRDADHCVKILRTMTASIQDARCGHPHGRALLTMCSQP